MASSTLLVRSRIVLPVTRPPIHDGAVLISGNCIEAVGSYPDLRSQTQASQCDLGDSILLPGLVNAHCHLDYTHMAGLFPPPPSFIDFIKLITSEKAAWGFSEFAHSWLDGAGMLLRTGTTTVGDVEAVPELLPDVWSATPLRVISFLEMTGIRSRRDPRSILAEAVDCIQSLPNGRCAAGFSPHAPYSTVPELLRLTASTARRRGMLITTHLSESDLEFEMFTEGRGEMFHWLKRNERDMSDCGGRSPVAHAESQGLLGANLLAIHLNYLAPGDADLLAGNHVSVVHCPRSHEYFRHRLFSYEQLANSGVNVCLGTDSLATVRQRYRQRVVLSMFDEMSAFAQAHPSLPSASILEMATTRGARALHLTGKAGELSPGGFADLISVPYARAVGDCYDAVVHHNGDVSAGMIGGEWVINPAGLP